MTCMCRLNQCRLDSIDALQMCNSFLPLLKKGGRIVNLASVAGHLRIYSKEVQEKFKDASESVDAVDQLYKEYLVRSRPP